mmetsp:Transcript_25201/g.37717  ORF Transcript_25201/g.37717 Transcript_25201/m.37717 type:complete len:654 (-) Transcript_25201:312-2273(-)|eukprot:CAMPEP_0203666562 /NCGR_PEP_ID=MMETSP0090-20130426/3576_1 /ASSEMBLY_ACC=CAM_ASM_001088 /TAXON_ID=426623 /ORGANISM="Chaetoceros affinis, Strain CCMP159" /LENGTH=653 /DNA_ID=CAMNT_0050530479 /DNA_START=52 /DNA_END=2013 /DNA_ORIENTATION=+
MLGERSGINTNTSPPKTTKGAAATGLDSSSLLEREGQEGGGGGGERKASSAVNISKSTSKSTSSSTHCDHEDQHMDIPPDHKKKDQDKRNGTHVREEEERTGGAKEELQAMKQNHDHQQSTNSDTLGDNDDDDEDYDHADHSQECSTSVTETETSSTNTKSIYDRQEDEENMTGRLKRKSDEGLNGGSSPPPPYKKGKIYYCSEEEHEKDAAGSKTKVKELSPFDQKEEQTSKKGASLEDAEDDSIESTPLPKDRTDTEDPTMSPTMKKGSCLGRRGDPRMNRSVAARLTRPELTLFQALVIGGFKFPDHVNEVSIKYSDQPIYDSDGVLLSQRKNQLSRRLRHVRRRCDKGRAQEAAGAVVNGQDNSLYFTDPKQCPLLRDQLQNIMYKTKMAINDPVAKRRSKMGNAKNGTITCTNDNHDNHEHNDNYNGGAGSSNNNGGDNTMSSVHQLPQTQQPLAVPSSAFTMLNHHQQVNSFQQQHQQQQQQQQQQHLHMLNELVKQHQLQEQLSLYASAATQPHLSLHDTSSSLGFDPSYYGLGSVGLGGIGSFGGVSALGPIANNFMQAPSIFPNVPTSNFTNEMLYNSSASIYKEPPRMNPAAAPFPLSLSLLNQQQEQDMKRRALVEAGFKEHEIDESLLEAMNAFHHNPFQH